MHQLIFCTCPEQKTAELLARMLIESRLAACVNIVPGLTSVYRWQGEIETAQECLLLIKSQASLFSKLETLLKTHHPYELPEIIAVNISQGATAYLQWLSDNIKPGLPEA